MKYHTLIFAACLSISVLLIAQFVFLNTPKPSNLDEFAKCLKEKKATFYGAFWCPHCQKQKQMFGNSEKFLPYVECSTSDSKDQLPLCKNKKIQGYPTWEFADGSRLSGEVTFEKLAGKTSCSVPK